jgi:hypothetical protein
MKEKELKKLLEKRIKELFEKEGFEIEAVEVGLKRNREKRKPNQYPSNKNLI